MVDYLTQLIDTFLISTWVGIITGIIVYVKTKNGSWFKIFELISLGFMMFVILLYVIHKELLNFDEWFLTLLIFLNLWIISKIICRARKK